MVLAPFAHMASYGLCYFCVGIVMNSLWVRDFVGSDQKDFTAQVNLYVIVYALSCFYFRFQDNKLEIACDNNATEPEKPTRKYNEELDNCCAELLETLKHMVILIFQT